MSAEQPEVEGEEEQREAAETSENEDTEEQPEIEPDEQADMGELADLAEQIEEEAGADVDDEDEDDSTDEEPASAPAAPSEGGAADWGDLYVGTVTTGLNAVIEEYGDDDASKIDESLARDLHLDEYVNDWMAEQGKAEMDPAQGMIVATAALCATVLVSRTDLPNKAVSKLQNSDD